MSQGALIDKLDQDQLSASNLNADLRRKLRVDRVRKMTLGSAAVTAAVDDENQPDWIRIKSLREI